MPVNDFFQLASKYLSLFESQRWRPSSPPQRRTFRTVRMAVSSWIPVAESLHTPTNPLLGRLSLYALLAREGRFIASAQPPEPRESSGRFTNHSRKGPHVSLQAHSRRRADKGRPRSLGMAPNVGRGCDSISMETPISPSLVKEADRN